MPVTTNWTTFEPSHKRLCTLSPSKTTHAEARLTPQLLEWMLHSLTLC